MIKEKRNISVIILKAVCLWRNVFILLISLVSSQISFAQQFTAVADANQLPLNDSFRVSYIVKNGNLQKLSPPDFSDFIVNGPFSENKFSIWNGKTSNSTSYTYILKPQKEGVFTIEGAVAKINGNEIKSNSISVKITAPVKVKNVFESADSTTIACNQFFNLKYKIHLKKFENLTSSDWLIDSIILSNFENFYKTDDKNSSFEFPLYTKQYQFRAIKPGNYVIPSISIDTLDIEINTNPFYINVNEPDFHFIINKQTPLDASDIFHQVEAKAEVKNEKDIQKYLKNKVFIKTKIPKGNAHIGDSIEISYKLYYRIDNLNVAIIKNPDFRNISSNNYSTSDETKESREIINGKSYYVKEFYNTILTPKHNGIINIEPLEILYTALFNNSLQDKLTGMPMYSYDYIIKSNPIVISVKPLAIK